MARIKHSFSSQKTKNIKNIKKQKEKFPQILEDIITISDIILEILDARFIEETRNKDIEKRIINSNKRIIYVLNKADLINSKKIMNKIKILKLYPYAIVSCKKKQGINNLRNKIKQEISNIKTNYKRTQIGIIGYPNTGKSSLINKLSRKTSAGTGSEAGFTKGMQKIRLNSEITLLDTPGVIPKKEYSNINPEKIQEQAIIGARTIGKIRDPEMVVASLMKNYSKEIEDYYKIKSNNDAEVLIEILGKKKNFIKQKGVVDSNRTANKIILDWQQGKIKI